jgi:hypothetical protein
LNENQSHHSVRRIVLPSGRSIEVVRFHEDEAMSTRELHICEDCGSDLVQPVAWGHPHEHGLELRLECPNCGWTELSTFSRDQVEQLEEKLDDGLTDMLDDLQRLTQANMSDEIQRFAGALQAGLILPEDF